MGLLSVSAVVSGSQSTLTEVSLISDIRLLWRNYCLYTFCFHLHGMFSIPSLLASVCVFRSERSLLWAAHFLVLFFFSQSLQSFSLSFGAVSLFLLKAIVGSFVLTAVISCSGFWLFRFLLLFAVLLFLSLLLLLSPLWFGGIL